ncbi:MAG: hypothetical protein V1729_04605 [Candidatus Woesearchaeota archaeon]
MSGKDKQLEHSEIVQALEERVRGRYNLTMTEVHVRDPETGRVVGEIDLVGIVDGQWDIYEVKVADNPQKARAQLERLRGYLGGCGNITLYYYSGKNKELTEIK